MNGLPMTRSRKPPGWRLLVNPKNPRVALRRRCCHRPLRRVRHLGALHERRKPGAGRIDISMLEAMCHFNLDDFTHYFSQNEIMGPYSRPSVSQSYVFECADGKWIAIHMSSPEKFWEGLAAAIEPNLFADPRFADRPAHQAPGRPDRLTADLKTRSRAEWCARLTARACRSPRSMIERSAPGPPGGALWHPGEGQHPTMGHFRTVRSPVLMARTRLRSCHRRRWASTTNIRRTAGQFWRRAAE